MECPECRFKNREETNFCGECGRQLPLICPACGSKNLPSGKFCDKCGHQLVGTKIDDKQAKHIESERKNVTILFSDVSGYTAITERLDPEELKHLMSQLFGEIAQVIVKYGGFIERFIGDAVMAIFGVPKVHEDDAVRAITLQVKPVVMPSKLPMEMVIYIQKHWLIQLMGILVMARDY